MLASGPNSCNFTGNVSDSFMFNTKESRTAGCSQGLGGTCVAFCRDTNVAGRDYETQCKCWFELSIRTCILEGPCMTYCTYIKEKFKAHTRRDAMMKVINP